MDSEPIRIQLRPENRDVISGLVKTFYQLGFTWLTIVNQDFEGMPVSLPHRPFPLEVVRLSTRFIQQDGIQFEFHHEGTYHLSVCSLWPSNWMGPAWVELSKGRPAFLEASHEQLALVTEGVKYGDLANTIAQNEPRIVVTFPIRYELRREAAPVTT